MDSKERRRIALATLGVDRETVPFRKSWLSQHKHFRKVSSVKHKFRCPPGKTREFYQSCRKKTRYPTQHEATKAARLAMTRRGVPLRVYWCFFCNGYHITKNFSQNRKGIYHGTADRVRNP